MLKHLLSTTALVLVLAAPAWAQTEEPAATGTVIEEETGTAGTEATGAEATGAEEPALGTAETETLGEEPATADTGTADTGTEIEATDLEAGTEAASTAPTEAIIPEEEETHLRADRLMGMSVVGPDGEEIGEVRDLILDENERITGVVVGLGGFLGLGQKRVGVNWDQAEIRQDPETEQERIFVTLTREDLENAPEFVTKEQRQAEEAQAEAEQQMQAEQADPAALPEAEPAAGQ